MANGIPGAIPPGVGTPGGTPPQGPGPAGGTQPPGPGPAEGEGEGEGELNPVIDALQTLQAFVAAQQQSGNQKAGDMAKNLLGLLQSIGGGGPQALGPGAPEGPVPGAPPAPEPAIRPAGQVAGSRPAEIGAGARPAMPSL